MSEADAVSQSPTPRTRASLTADLLALGVAPGDTLLVHASLRALGWVCGAAPAVLHALLDAVGAEGTLVFPALSSGLTEPSHWCNPPVPEAWWSEVRETMPAFDPARTPTQGIGRLPELFRSWPGVRRSAHPCSSFAAHGPHAAALTAPHGLDLAFGEGTPLARLYDLGARVLLLGVGYERCTSFHLAECRTPGRPRRREGGPVRVDGERRWVEYDNLDYDDAPFGAIGAAFEAAHPEAVRVGAVGSATARLVSQPAAVDFAAAWMARHLRPGEEWDGIAGTASDSAVPEATRDAPADR